MSSPDRMGPASRQPNNNPSFDSSRGVSHIPQDRRSTGLPFGAFTTQSRSSGVEDRRAAAKVSPFPPADHSNYQLPDVNLPEASSGGFAERVSVLVDGKEPEKGNQFSGRDSSHSTVNKSGLAELRRRIVPEGCSDTPGRVQARFDRERTTSEGQDVEGDSKQSMPVRVDLQPGPGVVHAREEQSTAVKRDKDTSQPIPAAGGRDLVPPNPPDTTFSDPDGPYHMPDEIRRALEATYGTEKAGLYVGYLTNPGMDRGTGERIAERLLAQERQIDPIILSQLQTFSDEAKFTPLDPIIPRAREEARAFFNQSRYGIPGFLSDYLRSHGISLILYGSLQYGDPQNLDIDLLTVAQQRPSEIDDFVFNLVAPDLDDYWESLSPFRGQVRGQPNFGQVSYLSDFLDLGNFFERDPEGYALQVIPEVISGRPLFPEDTVIVDGLKRQMREIVESESFLCAVTNVELEDCLLERLNRRQ